MKMHKNMTNVEIAELLEAVAAAYQLRGGANSRFRVAAYKNAADSIQHLSAEAKDLWDEGRLEDVSGVGPAIAGYLNEIFQTGKSAHLDKVLNKYPPAMFEMLKVSGIGPKTAYKISKELNITSAKNALSMLQKAAEAGRIAELPGMGEDSEKAILRSLKEVKGREERLLLPVASRIAGDLREWMEKSSHVKKVEALGSLRRKAATIGDVDLAVATNSPKEVIEHFVNYPRRSRVLEKGERTAAIIVPGDRQVDLMVSSPESFGSVLQHFTGSKHHNIALREYAIKHKMKVSDYGITRNGKLYEFGNEDDFYGFLGLEHIPPELREGAGEIEAAKKGSLPQLLELSDIKGDLQIHSNFDIETSHDLGASSMEDIIDKANQLNYEYVAFTEHNPSQSGHNYKQIIDILKRKKEKIMKLNEQLAKDSKGSVKIAFNSLEVDILPDGSLPMPPEGLELLDFALVSIHSSFRQDRKTTTDRVLSALSHPKVKIFAHPTGRRLGIREGVELNWEEIFEFAKSRDKWIEINASPERLDLHDFLVKEAVQYGVMLTLGTDAHSVSGMEMMPFGISVARRGWAEAANIVNTRTASQISKMLQL